MSGTINLAFTQQFDMDGAPLSGGLLYFFSAGTTSPQPAFQDTGLTIVHPNPIVLDASGRVPMFYLSDGFIKIRLTDKNGVTVIAADQLLVIGPSSGGGSGGGSTAGDVTAALQTGDVKARYDTAVKDGFVRLNGQSIGNVGSSATERAEAVCQALFEYLWAFSGITLDGFAKGANALADWGAGRRMFLPDLRGRTIAGLDDMGNPTPANRLTSTYFGASGITLGNVGGGESQAIATTNLPAHTHGIGAISSAGGSPAITVGGQNANHTHGVGGYVISPLKLASGQILISPAQGSIAVAVATGGGTQVYESNTYVVGLSTPTISGSSDLQSADHSHAVAISAQTSGDGSPTFAATPVRSVQPTLIMTFYMKL